MHIEWGDVGLEREGKASLCGERRRETLLLSYTTQLVRMFCINRSGACNRKGKGKSKLLEKDGCFFFLFCVLILFSPMAFLFFLSESKQWPRQGAFWVWVDRLVSSRKRKGVLMYDNVHVGVPYVCM
jgi:hypothetical protein